MGPRGATAVNAALIVVVHCGGPPTLCARAATQQAVVTVPDAEASGAEVLRVFLDCGPCDFDYLRREVTFVNYVRDRRDAQVQVIVTRESTGGGGRTLTFDFIGLEDLAGIDDQLRFSTTPNDTDDDERRGVAQTLRLGLVRYAAATGLGRDLEISHTESAGAQPANAQPQDDPWNFWVFRARSSMRVSGEERETSRSFGGSFSANRTTDAWKLNVGVQFDYDEDTFQLSDGSTFRSVSRDHAVTARVIKSLGDHWGAGFGGSAVTTTFRNQDVTLRIAPAIEYNVYPYAESTRRQLTFRYAIGADAFNYMEQTLFGRSSETRIDHSVVASLDLNEPWGESELTFEYAQFLDELAQHRVVLFGDLGIRLFRGFFLSLRGNSSLIRDQIYLPGGSATDEEILLRRRKLATDYEYSFRVGLTYSFGSIYNNVVNSRFSGSSGGFIRAF